MANLSATRERHPDVGPGRTSRVRYVARLMAMKRWVRGVTAHELVEDWSCQLSYAESLTSEASRLLGLLGERDAILDLVRVGTNDRLDGAENKDFVPLARLLIDTVGGFTAKSEVKHDLGGRSEREVFRMALVEIKKDPELRAEAIAFLQAEEMLALPEAE